MAETFPIDGIPRSDRPVLDGRLDRASILKSDG